MLQNVEFHGGEDYGHKFYLYDHKTIEINNNIYIYKYIVIVAYRLNIYS